LRRPRKIDFDKPAPAWPFIGNANEDHDYSAVRPTAGSVPIRRGLARLCRGVWRRGWMTRINHKDFQQNPRLPVSRGFSVWKVNPFPAPRPGNSKKDNDNMNNYRPTQRLPARFEPEVRFEVRPAPPPPLRAAGQDELERLKNRLLLGQLGALPEPDLGAWVRQAANEAAALAWVSPYPLLVFPGLFEEKIRTALRQAARQKVVRQRSRELLAA
jgi:hypothetical protein